MAAARSLWNGTLTFGSVAVPVKLFSAVVTKRRLAFREVRASDGATVEHRRVGADTGDEIEHADLVREYDDDGGEPVVLTKEEIAAAEGSHAKVVAIEHFVAADAIDPVYYDKPYLVGARDGGDHAYRVLLAALERSDRVGIGRFVLRSREQLVALRPLGGALGLQTMRFDDELVERSDLELPPLRAKPKDREVDMAGKLVEMLEDEWDPDVYEDRWRHAVLELVERKRKGEAAPEPRRRADDGGDLADALEASLAGGTGAKRRGGPSTGSAKKGTTTKGAAKKKAPAAKARKKPPAKKAPVKKKASAKGTPSADAKAKKAAPRTKAAAAKKGGS